MTCGAINVHPSIDLQKESNYTAKAFPWRHACGIKLSVW